MVPGGGAFSDERGTSIGQEVLGRVTHDEALTLLSLTLTLTVTHSHSPSPSPTLTFTHSRSLSLSHDEADPRKPSLKFGVVRIGVWGLGLRVGFKNKKKETV